MLSALIVLASEKDQVYILFELSNKLLALGLFLACQSPADWRRWV